MSVIRVSDLLGSLSSVLWCGVLWHVFSNAAVCSRAVRGWLRPIACKRCLG